MKKLLVAVLVVLALSLATAAPAFAHVHGITPLNSCSVDNADKSGAKDAQGSPLTAKGPIPISVGNAPLAPGDGGFSAPVQCP